MIESSNARTYLGTSMKDLWLSLIITLLFVLFGAISGKISVYPWHLRER